MEHQSRRELPIRSKLEMAKDIAKILDGLHRGDRKIVDRMIEDLKVRSIYFDELVQQDVLMFAEQVYFQYDYDPWHKVTPEITKAADRLIEALGFYR